MSKTNSHATIELSVIIPIYNVEPFLRQALNSILCLNHKVEYILVNDGSTDDSAKIAKSFCDKYENTKLISQQNGGLSNARNTGLRYVTGEWVYFFDSDDFVDSDFINNLLNLLSNCPENTLINLPVQKFNNHNQKVLQDGNNELMSVEKYAVKLINGQRQMGVWSYVFNIDLMTKHHLVFKDGALFEDQFFVPNYLKYVHCIKSISKDVTGFYHYRERNNSISNSTITESKILAKCKAEKYRDDQLITIVNSKRGKRLVRQNIITVFFRAYVDLISIKEDNQATLIRNQALSLIYHYDYGMITKKNLVKLLIFILPQNIVTFIIGNLKR